MLTFLDTLDRSPASPSRRTVRSSQLQLDFFFITSASFCLECSGYYLATSADDAVVKLWDLRKLKNFKNISLDDRYEVKDLCFDQSGTYLAVAGTDVR